MASSFDRSVLVQVSPDPRPTGLTYEPFYGLREKPFSLTSDSRFFYQSRSHAPAFDDLLNAIRRRESLNVLTGDIGTGKTTLCRAVLESLDRKTFSAFVPDPFASREDLLKVLLMDFGVASVEDVTSGRLRDASRTQLSSLLHEFLGTLASLQAFAVAFIDEAQNLSVPLLEETRILSDADGQLQVVLVGQLELRDKLQLPEMRQLEQRVSVHCQLAPLDLAGVAGYIAHRLRQAGASPDRIAFSGDAAEVIYEMSGGIPRIINRVCDRALRQAHALRAATIDRTIVEASNSPASARPLAVAAPAPERAIPQETSIPQERPAAALVAPPVPEPPACAAAPPPPASGRTRASLPDHLEYWLAEIEKEPQAEPVPVDWRERWAPTDAVSAPQPEGRTGVRLRIRSAGQPQLTQVERLTRRFTRRLVALAALLTIGFGALVVGPASIAASLDLWSEVVERVTPPPMPGAPHAPRLPRPAPLTPPASPGPDDPQ
jgi:general secretion pathway protein A